jgi:hypothetical protein
MRLSGRTRTLYLTIVPLAVLGLQTLLIGPAVEFSRNRAMHNAAPMIGDIERYREQHGSYPLSLLSVWRDYATEVIGVEQFHYEPSGDAYNRAAGARLRHARIRGVQPARRTGHDQPRHRPAPVHT